MWPHNALTERLGLDWPILSAPMGAFTTPSLAAAVSNAGGLGGLGMTGSEPDEVARRIAGFRQMSGRSLNANYLLWPAPGDLSATGKAMRERLQPHYDEKGLGEVPVPQIPAGEISAEHLAVLQESRPEAVSFHFGMPAAEVVAAVKAAGAYVICSATTVAEACTLEAQGADAIIAQGTEAGGHRGTFTDVDISEQPGLFALLPQVVDAVSVPVIAAGGIADGRGIAAAVMLGASAVQLGTAFLRCEEAAVPDAHRAALATADDASTRVTRLLSGRPARVVRNRLTDELADMESETLPFPAQLAVTGPLTADGGADFMALYSGQSAALTRSLPAADLVAALAEEATARLKAFA